MNKKIIVYLGAQIQKQNFIERIMEDLAIPCKFLTDEDLSQTTGYLMDLDGFTKQPTEEIASFVEDLMILQDISDEEISNINQLLKAFQIEMKRKAVLTEHNKYWRVKDLLQEICKEHQYFQDVEAIRELLSKSSELIIDAYTKQSWQNYEQAFYVAYECISKDATPEEVASAYHQLVAAKEALQIQN